MKLGSSGAGWSSRWWMYRPAELACHTSMIVFGTGSSFSSRTRPVTMIRSPIASPPVPAFVVRSASSAVSSASAGPGPVTSLNVCTMATGLISGDRFTVER